MANKLYWEMKEKPKDELIKMLQDSLQQLSNWSELAMTMAGYYYNIEPHATIFKDKTFKKETLAMVKIRANINLRNSIYKRVTFILRNEGDSIDSLPVDIMGLSKDEYILYERYITGLKVVTNRKDNTDGQNDSRSG